MSKTVMFTSDAHEWLMAQCLPGESINACVRRWAGLKAQPRGLRAIPKASLIDKRKKWPILDMLPGSELIIPWVRDPKTGLNVDGAMRGANAAVSRCNRLPGRSYRATATASGLHVVRIA